MEDIKLSDLSNVAAVASTDLFEISQDQGGETYFNIP